MQEIFLQTLSISSASTSTIHRHNWLTDNIQWLYSLLLLFLQHIYYFVWCCRDDKDSTEWNEKCWSLYFILFLWNIHFIIKKRMREWNVYEKWDGMVGFHIIIIIKIIFAIFCTCILFLRYISQVFILPLYPSQRVVICSSLVKFTFEIKRKHLRVKFPFLQHFKSRR